MTMRVQCLLPKRNNGKFFEAAIKSLATQNLPFDSILISENHSTDGSENMAMEAAKKYPNVDWFRPEKPQPTGGDNSAELIKRMDPAADYILIASADDIWLPNFNAKLVAFLQQSREPMGAIYCDRAWMNDQGRMYGASGNISCPAILPPTGHQAFRHHAKGTSYIIAGALFRRDVVLDFLPVMRLYEHTGDWIMMMEAARKYAIGYVAEPLFQYRFHANNYTKEGNSNIPFLKMYIKHLQETEPELAGILESLHPYLHTPPAPKAPKGKPGLTTEFKRKTVPYMKLLAHRAKLFKAVRKLRGMD